MKFRPALIAATLASGAVFAADPPLADLTKGQRIAAQVCAACHGADGKGNPALGAPNLTDKIWLYGSSEQAIIEAITKGRNGVMPAHKEFLGEAKAHLLAAYVYGLSLEPGSGAAQ